MGQIPHNFSQDSVRNFFKMDEKIIEGGGSSDLQRSRGRGQKLFSYAPTFIALTKFPVDR